MSNRRITIILSYNVPVNKANDNAADDLYASFQKQFETSMPEATISHVCIEKTLIKDEEKK